MPETEAVADRVGVNLWHHEHLVSVSLTTIEVGARDGGTHLRLTERDAFLDGEIAAAERDHGAGKLLDILDRFLAGAPVR